MAGEDVRGLIGVLLAAVASAGWSTISAYVPFGDEPGSPETLVLLHAAGFQILLRCTGRENLTWAVYDGELRPGRLGILEPVGENLGLDALSEVDAVIAPALAVDRVGTRIGYGRGYYDRALSRLEPSRPVLAVVYDDELVDAGLARTTTGRSPTRSLRCWAPARSTRRPEPTSSRLGYTQPAQFSWGQRGGCCGRRAVAVDGGLRTAQLPLVSNVSDLRKVLC